LTSSIFGGTYAGGGGGAGALSGGAGGSGGGAAGTAGRTSGNNGTINTGGGGGGYEGFACCVGPGYGGSGVVWIRYPNTFVTATTTGSPTFTCTGGYRVYKFTGSGTLKI
jgi:hypothetical protein